MNPIFNRFFGTNQAQEPRPQPQMANPSQPDWNALMSQLQANPAAFVKEKGYNVPDELNGNPQATVMHLIQSGQVGGPMMQMIRPYLARMGIR